MQIKYIDYFFQLYEKSSVPELVKEVQTKPDGDIILNAHYNEEVIKKKDTVFSIFFIPDYLYPKIDNDLLSIKKVDQFFKGYAIFLNGFTTVDAYVKSRFRSNAKAIRRRVRRLESCFSISYKMYYGEISKDEYDSYMDTLYDMLVKRFEQRNDVSQTLTRWDYYRELYFSLINQKKASLFVILEEDTPIVISLSHHFENRLFSAISSYDIDFGKFSLGSVEIYKKLEWCLANNHVSYEMGMGDLSYKREWCNHIYNFEHQIIYPKKSLLARIKAGTEFSKVALKEFVFKIAYVRYKSYKAKRKEKIEAPVAAIYDVLPMEEVDRERLSEKVDYNSESYAFLRNLVFDFLYSSQEYVGEVVVHKASDDTKSFYIVSKTKMQKVIPNA